MSEKEIAGLLAMERPGTGERNQTTTGFIAGIEPLASFIEHPEETVWPHR